MMARSRPWMRCGWLHVVATVTSKVRLKEMAQEGMKSRRPLLSCKTEHYTGPILGKDRRQGRQR
jgi:hypothetical protein